MTFVTTLIFIFDLTLRKFRVIRGELLEIYAELESEIRDLR